LYAATIGLAQNDIKRVLAYSTISQIGYMFLACGVGAFAAGIFHLTTHAFFKALLFMGAGSVIHALSGEQDMRYMGGLKNRLPHTYKVFLIATLSISGIPLLAGFFSKDEILWKAYSSGHGHPLLWILGLVTAILTAFYMFRLLYLTFHGKSNVTAEAEKHLHESPPVMLIPLYMLAFLAIFGGYIGLPHALGGGAWFENFLMPVTAESTHVIETASHHAPAPSLEYILMLASVVAVLLGIVVAYNFYIKNPEKPKQLAQRLSGFYRLIFNKYYIDEIYDYLIVKPLYILSLISWKIFDIRVIDGFVNGLARFFGSLSERFRVLQTGFVRNYALSFLIGVIILVGYLCYIFR
jgi:NADH-quinone oxidoreductase subunit L